MSGCTRTWRKIRTRTSTAWNTSGGGRSRLSGGGGGARCRGGSGEIGELSVGAAGDLVCWPQEGVRYAGALVDPVEAWLRCGPVSARHTIVAGQVLVRDGALSD